MKNIAIVCDSSVALTKEEAHDLNITVAPLTLIYNNKEYLDQIDMTFDDVNELLLQKTHLQTSQPNVGVIINILEELKTKGFDHIYVLSLSSALSGTHSAFHHAIQEVGLDSVTLIDSMSIAGPVQQCAKLIHKLNAEDKSIAEITRAIEELLKHTVSFVYPQTLDQLKISGRISKGAATLASLLKVKPLLYLENGGQTIEKFGTARTEAKVFDMMVAEFKKHDITPDAFDVYYLDSQGEEIADRFNAYLSESIGTFTTSNSKLPAVVAAHAGIGTIAVQWIPKI
ncbi:DegV family protein [Erysipelothrix sp. HDW6C]|uniref:DegV family protein n=1 Tax=Erysipelothrix sp. HDW6C TaxID=2714930 RepID=UPI0014079CF6|nr:DegV family protein [Erysipelothrix sp. HDW6C]QIK69103.1 DegV family protein [Erysipelothrix sp. HDW6C]